LRYARDAFAGLGATPWAARAAAELRATGEVSSPTTELDGAEALTPQERQVARLVSGGATNRDVAAQLFVSPKTVEYHLAKIFRKLGIKSRVELVKLETRDWD
jgi:DNA-binding CsgD family transcriptional regulator